MRKHFDFYGYNSPWDGRYVYDGVEYFLGEDFRSVKRYTEYKNVGFNILLLQHRNSYNGEDFSTSACKKCMDTAFKAGIDRVIVSDSRLKDLCEKEILIGENGTFKDETQLIDYIKDCTSPYANHPAFYGVQLFDEPQIWKLKAYSQVYKAFKKIYPNKTAQSNLLNLCAPKFLSLNPTNPEKDYEDYLNYFAENSGIDYLMTDEYPFRRGRAISDYTIPTFYILAKVCKERGIELRLVLQSFSQEGVVASSKVVGEVEGGIAWRRITEKDMYWQTNLALGFGCKEFSFFTYFTKYVKTFNGKRSVSDGVDGACFVNLDGSRTKLYYYTRKIIKEMKEFEKVLLPYSFNKAYFFVPEGKTLLDFDSTRRVKNQEECPVKINTPKKPIIVTELIHNDKKIFMVENIGNPMDEIIDGEPATKIEIHLGELAQNAKFYRRGKMVKIISVNGVITEKMHCGDALFIEV